MAEAVIGRRIRRILRRLAWGLLLLLLTSPLWLNLLLATPLVTGPVERAIHQRTGLNCNLDRLSLWPGRGLTLHRLRLHSPEEWEEAGSLTLLEVRQIHIDPRWSALLRGKLEVDSVTVQEARLDLPIEGLMAAMPKTPPPTIGPPLAVNTNGLAEGPSTPPQAGKPSPSQPPSAPTKPTPQQPTKPQPSPPHKTPAPARAPQPSPPKPRPTQWCHIENASLRLHSIRHPEYELKLGELAGSIPLGGKSATSTFTLSHIRLAAESIRKQAELQLSWDSPQLRVTSQDLRPGTIANEFRAAIRLKGGLPFEILTHAPLQDSKEEWQGPKGLRARSSQLGYRAALSGYLSSPASWRGYLLAAVRQARIQVAPHQASFQTGTLQAHLFPGGWLHCGQAELRDDDATLMARGDLWSDGRFAASLRLVTDPQQASGIAETLFPDLEQAFPMTPLSTPQRCAFDLVASGRPGQIELRAGPDGPVLNPPPDFPPEHP